MAYPHGDYEVSSEKENVYHEGNSYLLKIVFDHHTVGNWQGVFEIIFYSPTMTRDQRWSNREKMELSYYKALFEVRVVEETQH